MCIFIYWILSVHLARAQSSDLMIQLSIESELAHPTVQAKKTECVCVLCKCVCMCIYI